MYRLRTETEFDAAHFLADYYGKCENLHGHRWRVVVQVAAEELQTEGTERSMVMDFGAFKAQVRKLVAGLDHRLLVEEGTLAPTTLEALESEGFTVRVLPFRTTAENLARYVADELIGQGLPVWSVEMYETPANCAIYEPRTAASVAQPADVARKALVTLPSIAPDGDASARPALRPNAEL